MHRTILLATVLLLKATALAAPAQDFAVITGQRQLFLDDHGISQMEKAWRTLHQPKKKGAVIRPDRNLGIGSVQTRTAPAWDPERRVYKFWDIAGTPPDIGRGCSGYYESLDGLHWTKPAVGQVEYRGSSDNNFISLTLGDRHMGISCVVYDAADPDPARRFKAALPSAGFAVSPDGIVWTPLDIPAVPSSDEFNFTLDEENRLFLLTVKHTGPYGRSVHLSTSADFKTWSKHELIFHADELDQELGRKNIAARLADSTLHPMFQNTPDAYNVDVYNMPIFRYESVYIGAPALYHAVGRMPNYPNTDGFHLIQLVTSRDLKAWTRVADRATFIGPSPRNAGAFDMTQIIGPSRPVLRDDELWFYYTGVKYRGGWRYVGTFPNGTHVPLPGLDRDVGAVNLATLRRDGFVSLDAGADEGFVVTKPFECPPGRLFVNVDARDGEVHVDVLTGSDATEAPVATAAAITEDVLRQPVLWERGDLTSARARSVRLRFRLRNARLYSYWFDDHKE